MSNENPIIHNLESLHELGFEETLSPEAPNATSEVEHLEPEQIESIIESILFVSDRPIGLAAICSAFRGTDVSKEQILSALDRLTIEYASGRRGISLETIGGGYQLRNKIENTKYLKNIGKPKGFKLSGPALETLAIIAYKQPITKAEIDHIRGVESGHLVRSLMDRGLVAFAGKSEAFGKPMQYGTTKKFLEIFSLRNCKELPSLNEIDELIPEGISEMEGEKLQISELTEKLGEDVGTSYSMAEEELAEISEELKKISVTTSYLEEGKKDTQDKATE